MKSRIASLLFNQVGVLLGLILLALTAYVVIGRPAWAVDPLRSAASGALSGTGVSLILLLAWAGWAGWLLSRGARKFFRKWRYVLGFGLLALGASSVLSYFSVGFPLIGESPLGGAFGERVRGSDGALGALGTIVLLTFGAWLVAPVAFNHLALGAGRGAAAAGRGARAAGRGSRVAGSAVGSGISSGIGNMRRPQTVSEELDDFFAANASAPPSAGKRSLGAEYHDMAARATDPYAGRQTPDSTPSSPSPSGLAYIAPGAQRTAAPPRYAPPPPSATRSAPPSATRPAAAPAPPRNEKPNFWPGLGADEDDPEGAEPEAIGGAATAVLERESYEDSPPAEPFAEDVRPGAQPLDPVIEEAVAAALIDPEADAAPYEDAPAENGVHAPETVGETTENGVYAPETVGRAAGNGVYAPDPEADTAPYEDAPAGNGLYRPEPVGGHPENGFHQDEPLVKETVAFPLDGERENGAAPAAAYERTPWTRLEDDEDAAAPGPAPFPLPPLASLAPGVAASAISQEHLETAALIEETLAEHGVEVSVSEIRPGPSVTMFGLVPGWNRKAMSARARALAIQEEREVQSEVRNRVKVDSILAREKDLALALAAPTLRIQAPVPGEPLVGVEMPNKSSTMVTIRTVMESPEYEGMLAAGGLPVALGLATAGDPVVIDLLKMPHLLIAGATGSGKSVCINTIISSIICHQDPAKVRMLLVDPKRVELTPYNGIPHLVTPVVVDPDKVVRLLRGAIQEMMRRYKLLEEAGARNIASYNRSPRAAEPMPYFVICIDELADLMMTASFDVEQSLCRLAQLGRATGIHLIVATQRPSVDVLTGLIKANFPSRIAFAVASQVDSRTILDSVGAERLIGRGDMLFLSSDSPKPRRVQGVYISEDETAALSEHWRHLPVGDLPAVPLEEMAREVETAEAAAEGPDLDEADSLYDRALQLAATNRQLSTSLLQRRLRIGYPRAARLMDQLEDDGVVASSGEPGKPREVIAVPGEPSFREAALVSDDE